MSRSADKIIQTKSLTGAGGVLQRKSTVSLKFNDVRSGATAQLKMVQAVNGSSQVTQLKAYQGLADGRTTALIQMKASNTGLPDSLKSGIENISGYSMDDVKVHYNSAQPAQLQAHAYAQGSDIHIGPGQEKHLPHEAWHVVQQKQGRVKPTMQMKALNVNDSSALEKEADVMGAKAAKG